jgi:hypothetical protein
MKIVMAGHRRSKNGVASLAYVLAIHVFPGVDTFKQDVGARVKPAHDGAMIGKSRHPYA